MGGGDIGKCAVKNGILREVPASGYRRRKERMGRGQVSLVLRERCRVEEGVVGHSLSGVFGGIESGLWRLGLIWGVVREGMSGRELRECYWVHCLLMKLVSVRLKTGLWEKCHPVGGKGYGSRKERMGRGLGGGGVLIMECCRMVRGGTFSMGTIGLGGRGC